MTLLAPKKEERAPGFARSAPGFHELLLSGCRRTTARRVVAIPRPRHQLALPSRRNHVDVYGPEASVARRIGRIVGERVLMTNIMRHLFADGVHIFHIFREVSHASRSLRDG